MSQAGQVNQHIYPQSGFRLPWEWTLGLAIILIGISSITAQIVLMRELLIFFYGNELSIGIILAGWLFWTSLGSWFGGRVSKKIKQPVTILALTEIILSFLLIFTILSTRGINFIIPRSHGEMLGILPIWLYSFILLAGICFVNGFLFVVGCKSIGSIGKAYILESIGAGMGGLLCSIVLIRYFNTFQIIWLLVLANLSIAGLLWKKNRWVIYLGTIIILILGLSGIIKLVGLETRRWQWHGYKLVTSRDSIYGNITITRQDSIYNFYESGLLAFSVPDRLSSEETTHLALLQHLKPNKILLIGGGLGGVIEECLKYPDVNSIVYVELDPLVITLAKGILQDTAINNPKVRIYNTDGRRFLKNTTEIFDVIIVDLPDPNTAQVNRFYTMEFFKSVSDHLGKNGVFSIGITSSENYISPELSELLRCIYFTLQSVFPEIKVIPGDYCRFISAKDKGFLTDDYKVLEERLKVETQYVRDYYLKGKLSRERLDYMQDQLSLGKPRFLNTDFHPICYYYNITFWSTHFNTVFKKVFQFMAKMKLWHFSLILLFAMIWPWRKNEKYVLLPIMTSGFSEISFQVVTILAFQIIYGYVYYKLGIIITSFMIGLALGSFCINKIMPRVKDECALFFKIQIGMVVYPLLLPIVFYIFSKSGSRIGENIVLPYLPVIAGFIGGFQFPLGNKIYLGDRKEIGLSAGITYGIDLFGACIGVLLISAFILPILGITQTCFLTFIVNLGALIIMVKTRHWL